MKKRILIFFIVLLIIQTASAEMILDDFESSIYNKGEELTISGTILRDTAVEGGSLRFKLICEDLEFNLPTLSITVKSKEAKIFSTAPFMVPSAAEGDCHIEISLLFDEVVLEEKYSESFKISDELKAEEEDFQVNPIQVQLGKTLTLYGYITNINDEPITGLATIYFKSKDKHYYINNVDVLKGKLEYSYTATDNKPGEYFIDVSVTDLYGNKKLFENVAKFNIVDEVHIFIEPIQKKVPPGSIVHLLGKVNTILGDEVNEGTMQIILEDEIYSAEIKNGEFDYNLKLPEKITTGKHMIIFSFVEEKTGNWGNTDRTIYIESVPTEIRLDIFQDSVKPEQLLDIITFIYDQANEEIEDDVNVGLTDPNGRSIYLDSVSAGEKLSIEIPQYSTPGIWKLKTSYSGLEAEKEITVEEVKNVEIELINETIYITNTGNIDYNEPISIDLNDGDYVLTKKVSIKPSETLTLDLTKEAPSGQYNLKITGAAVGANQFDNVIIVGKNKKSLNFIYSFLLFFTIVSLAYLSIFKKRHFENIKTRSQRDVNYAKSKLRKLKAMKEKESKKPIFNREQSIADFKKRILKDINETEEKIKRSSSTEKKKDYDQPSGLFNMFN